jgi:mannose/cellobiose epimerase-like protein (N-acyl-D-glucosamine 2-epimerase family)
LILSSEISPKYLARRKELMLAFFRRGLKLVSARTAFGDASELDALNQTRAVIFFAKLYNHEQENNYYHLSIRNDALSVERMQRKRHHGHLLAQRQDGRVADRTDR